MSHFIFLFFKPFFVYEHQVLFSVTKQHIYVFRVWTCLLR